jgi:hypothetical protein
LYYPAAFHSQNIHSALVLISATISGVLYRLTSSLLDLIHHLYIQGHISFVKFSFPRT